LRKRQKIIKLRNDARGKIPACVAISGYMGRLSLYSYSYHILENLAGNTSILVFKKFRFLVETFRNNPPAVIARIHVFVFSLVFQYCGPLIETFRGDGRRVIEPLRNDGQGDGGGVQG